MGNDSTSTSLSRLDNSRTVSTSGKEPGAPAFATSNRGVSGTLSLVLHASRKKTRMTSSFFGKNSANLMNTNGSIENTQFKTNLSTTSGRRKNSFAHSHVAFRNTESYQMTKGQPSRSNLSSSTAVLNEESESKKRKIGSSSKITTASLWRKVSANSFGRKR